MKRAIIRFSDGLHIVVRHAATFCVATMLVVMLIQVFARYALNAPPTWTEEIARYAMVWCGLLGATVSFKTGADAVLLPSIAPPSSAALTFIADLLRAVAVLIFLGPVLWYCFFNLRGEFWRGYLGRQAALTADTLGFPMVWVAIAVPLSATIILLHLAAQWCARGSGAGPATGTDTLLD